MPSSTSGTTHVNTSQLWLCGSRGRQVLVSTYSTYNMNAILESSWLAASNILHAYQGVHLNWKYVLSFCASPASALVCLPVHWSSFCYVISKWNCRDFAEILRWVFSNCVPPGMQPTRSYEIIAALNAA